MTIDHSQLLIDVQKKSNIIVTNVRDVKYLKEAIEANRDLKIGYNTLRRLFGFLKQTTPSISTLNTLARFLEYKSYTNYINTKVNFDEWYFQQKLLLIQQSNTINEGDIKAINSAILLRQNIVFVAYFISSLIENNNLNILNKFFKKIDFRTFSDSNLLKFATIVTHSFYRIEHTKAITIYQDLIAYKSFRNTVPLLYIDYSNLNTIYIKVLDLVEKHTTVDSDIIFIALMRFYKQFYTNAVFENIKIELPNDFSEFHPVLKGRYFAYKIMSSNTVDDALKRLIFIACKTNKINLFLEEVIPALLIKEEYEILTELSEKFYEDIFESDDWSTITTNSIFLIALANVNWHSNAIKMAKKNLELVNLEQVELSYYDYVSLFYYHTKMKISHSENDKKTNASALLMLNQIVLKTGFSKFNSVSEKHIID